RREPHRVHGGEPPRVDDLPATPLGLADHVPPVRRLREEGSRVSLPAPSGPSRERPREGTEDTRGLLRSGLRYLLGQGRGRVVRRRGVPPVFLSKRFFVLSFFVFVFFVAVLPGLQWIGPREGEGHPGRLVRLRRLALRGPPLGRLRHRGSLCRESAGA